MRIAVTGSSGFIGQRVVNALDERGFDVRRYDHPLDIRDRAELLRAVADCDGIINLAGALGTTEIFGSELEAADVNILGAIAVYDVGAAVGIPVVQIGTGHKGQPNPYAITKAAAEDLGLARARYCDEKINVVRAFHVYGPGQKATPPYGKGAVRKIIPSFVCRALAGDDLEIFGTGDQVIDLVYVDEVADVLVDALTGPYGQLLEAGTGKPTTVTDAALEVIAATNSVSRIRYLPMRPGEPEDATVVAASPWCENPWPYRLGDTINYYRP